MPKTSHVAAGLGLAAAAGIAYLATRTTGPVPLPAFTELRSGPLTEHVVTRDGLLTEPVPVPQYYPSRVAPSISNVIARGFAPLWQLPDPQIADLPAEEMW